MRADKKKIETKVTQFMRNFTFKLGSKSVETFTIKAKLKFPGMSTGSGSILISWIWIGESEQDDHENFGKTIKFVNYFKNHFKNWFKYFKHLNKFLLTINGIKAKTKKSFKIALIK